MKKTPCPFAQFKPCREGCSFYRKGIRFLDETGKKKEPFEECAINIGVDCLENLVSRSIGNQKATEEVRNQVSDLNKLFLNLAVKKEAEIAFKKEIKKIKP